MEYSYLGKTGIQVSSLCFGTMSFAGDADEKTSLQMYELCRDRGVNFFDCANVYQKGRAEEVLGRCIKGHRNEIVLTSKACGSMSEDINNRGASRKSLRRALEDSLRRLNTDYLDIYFMHRFDDNTPIEETLSVLDQFVREGKILYPAASNYSAWQVMKALGVSAREGLASFKCIQPMYSLLKRQAEVEIFPMAQSEGLGVITYSPLGGGLLSGKYAGKSPVSEGRFTTNTAYQSRYRDKNNQVIVDDFISLARELTVSPVSLALAWAGSHPAVTAPIMGARNISQLKEALDSLDVDMTDALGQRISELSATVPSATDRSEI
ncbi:MULTISPECIES: aldo/keto reductase [unclassified Oceanispirochaeta]|uniref:aldo/keto reductase n=1 Tax=unclassified Oceanispirochaeta TaxID=2635722 RepID=UPI000E093191|nr:MULTISPECIES: aldo/keto reductase [unclassified Oceanispirochaeta]MBF9017494.1 aldo/keto reductase [Oceanispirochaeta sp. M2]NPD74066.1 aldo/keto reductase [Oceanispirochaeta sp. M1]RDG30108.1 aldo/keto reductase [Oceanispirochaeta sp. M1]